jgi:hypothetical protein
VDFAIHPFVIIYPTRNGIMAVFIRFILTAIIGLVVLGWPTAAAQSLRYEAELQDAARHFRIATYRHFRDDPATYGRRVRGSEALISRWRSRGAAPREALDLLRWFENATSDTQQGRALAPLPHQVASLGIRLEAMPAIEQRPTASPDRPGENNESEEHSALPAAASPFTELPASPALPRRRPIRPLLEPKRVSTRVEIEDSPRQESLRVEKPAVDVAVVGSRPDSNAELRAPKLKEPVTVPRQAPAKIKTSELVQRLAAHNRSIRTVETQLRQQEEWSIEQIEREMQQIEDLRARHDLWKLYVDVLDSEARQQLGSVETFDKCFELIQQRVFEMQIANETEPLSKATMERSRRLQAIDERVQRCRIQ